MDQNQDQNRPAGRGVKAWTRGLLLVSLGVNVIIISAVAGAYIRFGGGGSDKRPPRQDEIAGTYTRALSPDDRRAIVRQMRSKQADFAVTRAQFRADFAAVIAALRAAEFDKDSVAAIFERQRSYGVSRVELGHELLLDRLSLMSAEDRAAFADRLERSAAKKDKRQGPGGGDRPKPPKD